MTSYMPDEGLYIPKSLSEALDASGIKNGTLLQILSFFFFKFLILDVLSRHTNFALSYHLVLCEFPIEPVECSVKIFQSWEGSDVWLFFFPIP